MRSFDSLRPRRRSLRVEALEARVVPTLSIGTEFTSGGSIAVPPVGNSGAIGPNNYVLFQSGEFAVFQRDGTPVAAWVKTDASFWEDMGVAQAVTVQGLSEPRVIYDPDSARWFATEINLPDSANVVLLAVSDTSDPTGTWSHYSFTPTSSFTAFPTLAVDHTAVYIGGATFFSQSNPVVFGTTMTTIPKADLTGASPTLANLHTVAQGASGGNRGWAPAGVTNPDPSDSTGMIVATHQTTFGLINLTDVTVPATGAASYGTTANRTIPYNGLPGNIRQPDGTQNVSGGDDDRYAGSVIQVGDLIYAVHAISVDSTGAGANAGPGTTDGIQLIVISDATNQVVATKTYFNTNFDYSYPSVAANQFGDILIGFNRSGSGAGGNIGSYAVYAKINPASPTAITFGQEIELKAGSASNYHQTGITPEEWGPYSAIAVDPTNPFAFWTTQEYAISNVQWASRVTEVLVSAGPQVTAVSSTTPNGTYGIGAQVHITVTFGSAVNVTGTPRLALNSGGFADYTGGTGTATLTFTYTVAAGQSAADLDYSSATALTLNGGTIKDAVSAAAADLTLAAPGSAGSLGAAANIVIDTTAAKVAGVNSPTANGTYAIGDTITITVTFDRPVTVTGSPQLALNSGGTAHFVSATATTLTFTYAVAAGESSADLDAASATALTGGTITDQVSGAAAVLTVPTGAAAGSLAANKNLVVDALPPRVTDVNSPAANQTYHFGDSVSITVTFNHPVTVTGVPAIALNSNGTATYANGSGSSTLVFTYVVAAGDLTADLDAASATALTGGVIVDVGGQSADRTLPTPGQPGSLSANKNIAIDATQAVITNVTSPAANATYGPGAVITITLQYNRPVVVDVTGGTPTIALNSGGTATYASGSGTTTLTFTYTVLIGDNSLDLDAASATALSLNGGTIQEPGGLAAYLGLPTPGQLGSLGANKNIVVDGLGPTVTRFYVLYGSKKYDLLTSSRTTDLPWMITGVQVWFSEAVVTGNVRSLGGFAANRFTGLKTKILTWRFPAITKGSFTATLATGGLNALKDKAGNPVIANPMAFKVLYGDVTDDGVVDAADETAVRANLTGPYQLNPIINNLFADLSGDGLVNLIDVGITRTKKGSSLP